MGNLSVGSLLGAKYSRLTSVKSVIVEPRERFQSHSMKSYRLCFQRICDLCMSNEALLFLGVEQIQPLLHLQQWLGPSVAAVQRMYLMISISHVGMATFLSLYVPFAA